MNFLDRLSMAPGGAALYSQVLRLSPQDKMLLEQITAGLLGGALVASVSRFLGAKGAMVLLSGLAGAAGGAYLFGQPAAPATTGTHDFFGRKYR